MSKIKRNIEQIKTVKINLKEIIGDFISAYESKDDEELDEIKEIFNHFFISLSEEMKANVFNFLYRSESVRENKWLMEYFCKFITD